MRVKVWKSRASIALSAFLCLSLLAVGSPTVQAANTGSAPCVADVQTTSTVVTASSGGNCYVVFLSGTNTWTVPSNISSASVIVIGGGGAGGSGAWAGGGGAGGLLYIANKSLTPSGTYSTSIGAGGTAGAANLDGVTNRSNNGNDSWFESSSTFVAKGGGAGASYSYSRGSAPYALCDGNNGGSGGGAPECNNAGYSNDGGTSTQTLPAGATAIYGNSGGGTPSGTYASGGGGGGSGAVGSSVTTAYTGAAGGTGTAAFSSWLSAISSAMSAVTGWSTTTTNGNIAGGGGGSGNTAGGGGAGGGGAGGTNVTKNGTAGVANTGSGGGAAGYDGTSGTGGAGGSGIIIIRYTLPSSFGLSLAGNPTSIEYNRAITISATITGQDGKVTFFADGKIIPGCRSRQSTSLVATCTWRPIVHRTVTISASLINSSTVSTTPMKILVVKRSNKR